MYFLKKLDNQVLLLFAKTNLENNSDIAKDKGIAKTKYQNPTIFLE